MSSIPRQILTFFAVLAVLFAGGVAAGNIIGDTDDDEGDGQHGGMSTEGKGHGNQGGARGGGQTERARGEAAGLAVAQDGLRLIAEPARFRAGETGQLRFRIARDDGSTLREFELEHEKRMHLIVVRRDMTGYQHLHPRRTAGGGWAMPLRLAEPGSYRVFTDFKSGGERRTLGTDVSVAGVFRPVALPDPSPVSRTGPYTVSVRPEDDGVRFSVARDGRPVADLEPYLGARGHLVALREGDLAYLHVHPKDEATKGRDVRFGVDYPSAGRYRLFLQFRHEGRVHTATFTREAS